MPDEKGQTRDVAQDFAGVDLGLAGDDDQFVPPAEPVPAWQRRSVVAGLFAFGLVIGVLGWQARVESVVDVDLVASGVGVQGQSEPDDPGIRHFGLNLYNAGRHDLSLVGLALPGWEPAAPDERDQILRSETWTTVDVAVAPTCEVPVPEQVIATVRRDTADVALTLELPPEQEPLGVYGDACSGVAAPLTVTTLQNRQWLNARTDGCVRRAGQGDECIRGETLVTEISVSGSVADHAVLAMSASAAGVAGEAVTVPVPMLLGGRVDLAWEITDCADAENAGEVVFDITVDSVAGERTESVALSEPYLTYVLANYVAREC